MNKKKLLSDIKAALKEFDTGQLEGVWCDVCGDNPKYDKGGYGDEKRRMD